MRNQLKAKKFLSDNLVLMTILILVGVTAIIEPKFLSIANLGNIMNQFGPLSFVSLGMTVAIIGGFIDLSVVGIVSLSAVFTISMIDVLGQYGALIAGLGAGTLMGFINAQLIISCGALTQVTLPWGTGSVGRMSFFGCSSLSFVKMPPTTKVEDMAFDGCSPQLRVFGGVNAGRISNNTGLV